MKVIIYGAGKQAELARYLFENDSTYEVVAFALESQFMDSPDQALLGLPVISLEYILHNFSPAVYKMHIAIGENDLREKMFILVKSRGFSCANYICSKAQTWGDLEIGENVFIDQGTRIHPFVKIGNNTILLGADIGHHSRIGNNVLMSGSTTAGSVTVGDNSFLGLHSSVKQNVTVGHHNIIGVGAFIGHDTNNHAVYSDHCSRRRNTSSEELHLFR